MDGYQTSLSIFSSVILFIYSRQATPIYLWHNELSYLGVNFRRDFKDAKIVEWAKSSFALFIIHLANDDDRWVWSLEKNEFSQQTLCSKVTSRIDNQSLYTEAVCHGDYLKKIKKFHLGIVFRAINTLISSKGGFPLCAFPHTGVPSAKQILNLSLTFLFLAILCSLFGTT